VQVEVIEDPALRGIAKRLAEYFKVSSEVIEKRLAKDELWHFTLT
jgi:hypothetical protein